ncbi:MAG: MFS transporter, partial [Pseudomonadota bacterium]
YAGAYSFTGAIVLSAFFAPIAGRLVDGGHGRIIMCGSAVIAALCLGGLAFTTSTQLFVLFWLLIGICMAFCLYEACLSYCVVVSSANARKIVTRITLIAGFAGTLSFPFAHHVEDMFGHRGALLGFAALALLAAFCFHTSMVPHSKPIKKTKQPTHIPNIPVFVCLACAFSFILLAHGMIISHILPILQDRAISLEMAVLAASLFGPVQVLGRVILHLLEERISLLTSATILYGIMGVGAILLLNASQSLILIFLFVVCHGAGYGANAILRPIISASLLGSHIFGTISGLIALPSLLALAGASSLAATLWAVWGYDTVIILCASLAFASIILIMLASFFVRH